ncbi:uncharacterized protein LOC119723550 [Patiria miniata]|uniref:Apple domain-containing protein n=1 Tax=Patiria miniata TaxID=46514 RepID=A0A913ZGP6_PATMI|nr:uncharacterized protein LOC119723550 [Patiria miniata]
MRMRLKSTAGVTTSCGLLVDCHCIQQLVFNQDSLPPVYKQCYIIMTALQVILIAMIFCANFSISNGSPPVKYSNNFEVVEHGNDKTVPRVQRVFASSIAGSKHRCAVKCLKNDRCWQFCYVATTGQCVLQDASLAPKSGGPSKVDNCTYFSRKVCSSTYQLEPRQNLFAFPAFNGNEFVLDFSVQSDRAAKIALSTDGTKANSKYHLVLGHGDNTKTTIRRCHSCSVLHSVTTLGFLSEHEMRRFWLRYDHGAFAVGKHQQTAFFEWTDPQPQDTPMRFFGFASFNEPQIWAAYHTCN